MHGEKVLLMYSMLLMYYNDAKEKMKSRKDKTILKDFFNNLKGYCFDDVKPEIIEKIKTIFKNESWENK